MPKTEIHKVPVRLTEAQFRALTQGKKIRLKGGQLTGECPHTLHLVSKVKARKLHGAVAKNKGCEITLTPDEFRHTMEGEGFKDFAKKAGKWLSGAAKSVWSGVKDASRLAKYAGYRLTDAVADSLPAVAPVAAEAAMAYYNPMGAATSGLMGGLSHLPKGSAKPGFGPAVRGFNASTPGYMQAFGGGSVKNPADHVRSKADIPLFGIHHQVPDRLLVNTNSNFLPGSHPASHPTILRGPDALSNMHLGKVVSGEGVRGMATHPAMHPVIREQDNIRNTPAALTGGSFMAAGYGFKPAGY